MPPNRAQIMIRKSRSLLTMSPGDRLSRSEAEQVEILGADEEEKSVRWVQAHSVVPVGTQPGPENACGFRVRRGLGFA